MKDMFKQFVFKPRDLKASCEKEGKAHKVKLAAFAALMFTISNTYSSYFQNLVYRSGMYQQHALAGESNYPFMEYIDGEDPRTLWEEKNLLDVLDQKDFKQLKFMHAGWKDTEYEYWESYFENETRPNVGGGTSEHPVEKFRAKKAWTNANGDPYDNVYYFTQTQRAKGEEVQTADRDSRLGANRISWSQKQYDNWNTMHDGTIWFDTAGCLAGAKIGDVNAVAVTPTTQKYKKIEAQSTNPLCPESSVDSTAWNCAQFVDKTNDEDMQYEYLPLAQGVWEYTPTYSEGAW